MPSTFPIPPPIKALAYPDDILVIIHNPADLEVLFHHLNTYQKASNAKFNKSKTQTIALSGQPSSDWNSTLHKYDLPICHNRTNTDALVYLGFLLLSSSGQLDRFMSNLLETIQRHC